MLNNIFPIKEVTSGIGGKISKRDVTAYAKMTEYVYIALSDLVFNLGVSLQALQPKRQLNSDRFLTC